MCMCPSGSMNSQTTQQSDQVLNLDLVLDQVSGENKYKKMNENQLVLSLKIFHRFLLFCFAIIDNFSIHTDPGLAH